MNKLKYDLVNALDVLGWNNNGYLYGIEVYQGLNCIECFWYKTKTERLQGYNQIKKQNEKLGGR